ncbi:MAG: PASTA domain-containing protein [Clostridia bacterium]|nr:PASTA domain-containing protein [Clostridia bacterium]
MKKKNTNNDKRDNKIIKISSVTRKKSNLKMKILLVFIVFILASLLGRIAWLQFVDGNFLREQAYSQQTINQIISPKRGNIYDSTGKTLATSAQVDTVTINPKKIKANSDEATTALKEKIAHGLSDIFELDYNETLTKITSNSSVETIAKKVEQAKITELKKWMEDNKITIGINIDEDSKRYYPYNNVASGLLGFCGNDNQGLSGIEYSWDSTLTGTSGKIVASKDASQGEIPNTEETYIAAENGSDLTLTIDLNIQTIVEKYLKQAVEYNSCSRGGNVIVMNPSNGDILAMASYPDYNLNTPFTPNSALSKNWDSLSSEEQKNALQSMWNCRSISEPYEPGSTFKVITSSVALEENITDTDIANNFVCTGSEKFSDGTEIKCWRTVPHGYQTLRQALMNSCNPAFMQLGKKIGAQTLYKYYKAFGLFDKTGVGLSGEASSSFWTEDKVGAVELATMSFGQRFTVTPLQMITAISAVANDGVLMKPRIVKEVKNTESGSVTTVDPIKVRQVLSKETSEKVKSMMESVVTQGTGKHGAVSGYSIGGKTGTSEPLAKNVKEGYVASYVAISPIEDTRVAILLALYDPQGKSYQGGQVAGPVVSQMLSEILPYLEIPSSADNTDDSNGNTITLPNVTNKTITEAKKIIESAGFKPKINVSGDENSLLVKSQVPVAGTQLINGATILLYSEENDTRTSVTVPDLRGLSVEEAIETLKNKNLNISISGKGYVTSQDYAKDSTVEEGTVIRVTFKETLKDAH